MRKSLIFLMSIILGISVIMGNSLCASAAWISDQGYGTFEEGIISKKPSFISYYQPADTNGLANGDFEKGFMYWSSCSGERPDDAADIVEENGNHFMRLTPQRNRDGLESLRFVDSRIKAGDKIAIMYDWRSDDPNFCLSMRQHHDGEGENYDYHNVSTGRGSTDTVLVYTDSNSGWNTSITPIKNPNLPKMVPVIEPKNKSGKIYLSVCACILNDRTTTADIDNIRIVFYNNEAGIVKDLDGNKIFDLSNIDMLTKEDFSVYSFDVDFNAQNESLKKADTAKDKGILTSVTFWIIITAVIVIIGAVIVLIVARNKKLKEQKDDNGN